MRLQNKKRKNTSKILFFIFLVLAVVLLLGLFILKKYFYPLKHFDIVKQEASKNNIDPYLVMSIIKAESGFNKHAVSSKQAKGLMQIMDSTANDINNKTNIVDDLDNENIYDENINIALGCDYFSSLVKRYNGNYYIAICAYNAGMGNVDKWIDQGYIKEDLDDHINNNIPISETKKYLNKVISSYKMYRILY